MKINKLKAIFIDVVNKEVKAIEVVPTEGWHKDILRYNKIELFGLKDGNVMIIDEEARLKPRNQLQGWFVFALNYPIINNALLIGSTGRGTFTNTSFTLTEINRLVQFEDLLDLR